MPFDTIDRRIRYYELVLEREGLDDIKPLPLPAGYRFHMYAPGDREAWIAIEMSAKELTTYEKALAAWERCYAAHEGELPARMVFVENAAGEKVATATAYFDTSGRDTSGAGWLHWVAVRREDQGKGLSKPLISRTLQVMRGLGYTHIKIPTQTTTWVACKIYLDFGFTPIPANAVHSREGWRIIKALTGHPALSAFEAADADEICAPGVT